jgi:hypothetical protein
MRTIGVGCVLAMACLLTACGGHPPANTTVSGTVESAKRITTTNRLTGGSHNFELVVKADDGETWRPSINGGTIQEDEVRRAIGKRATFTCYRPEPQYKTCFTHTFVIDGRDRMHPAH